MTGTILNPFLANLVNNVPEIAVPVLKQLEKAFVEAQHDPVFQQEFQDLLKNYAGRPTALTLCRNLTKGTKTKLYLKLLKIYFTAGHIKPIKY